MNIQALESMLQAGKDSAMLRFTLAQLYQKNNNENENISTAITHLKKALELDAGYTAAWNLLGQCYNDSGQPQLAKQAYQNGLEVAQKNGDKQMEKMLQVFIRRIDKASN